MKRLALAVALVLLAACSKSAPPVPDEATLRAEDKRELEGVVAIDVRASHAMRDADDATRVGDAGAASLAVTSRAAPAVDEALRAAESATMKSAWGKAKRDELAAILRDRKAEMPKYDEAVQSNDPEKMLTAIQAQAAIERRALATVAAVQEGR
ncbi:MAG: hypothetical protein JWO86_1278 [Myxococcaceae bacterium]|nr:hypothetical protein [Myxococcaceae bacterium]MEA2752420.1 hypothetical protein [Myxococcales bacterium]